MIGKRLYSVMLALVLILTVVSVTAAAHTTINTNDGGVDANWSLVTPISNDGDDVLDDSYDIDQAWITNAADNSAFYFRVTMLDQLPHNYSSFEARLDCDQDGSFHGAQDMVVYYAIYFGDDEEIVECQGQDYWECDSKSGNTSDMDATDTFGEELNDGTWQYEWMGDVTNGDADWSACLGEIDVQFATLDSSFVDQDTTVTTPYNAVTSVDLTGTPQSSSYQLVAIIVAGGMIIALLISGLRYYRKQA